MTYVLYIIAALLVLDALRMRGRIRALDVLADSDEPATHVAIVAPGVRLDDATVRAASAYMRARSLDVLDLVPRDLPALQALAIAQLVDPKAYARNRLGAGRTAGHALLASRELLDRARAELAPADAPAFVRLAVRLPYFGPRGIAIAPRERALRQDLAVRYRVLRAQLGPGTSVALAAVPVLVALFAAAIAFWPLAGAIAVATWQLQPAFALAGRAIASRDLALITLLRAPIELYIVVRTLRARGNDDRAAALRDDYARALDAGPGALLEPRRETCPLCDARDLAVHIRSMDLLQHKPGRFTLERCRACGHIFQNPRLTLAGLDYYYRDFYDGLGEDGMEFIFGFGTQPYLARTRMVKEVFAAPTRWLDVGAGHGHLCMAARELLPTTRFDGLDLSESIEEAKRRGWVERAYRGLFPALAAELAGRYDVVSMSHYLEHTLDPRAELAAAHVALNDGGCLMIELPDPDYRLGRVLRRYWLPWFQPQHLHLLSTTNLERLLREHGFEPLTWHRGAAHQRVDFFFAIYLMLDRIAPAAQLPWRWRGAFATGWRVTVWTLGAPLVLAGTLVDNLIGPLMSRARVSNTFRVVARKRVAAAARAA
jgi:SAM-dependent methyltransferase